MVLNCPLCNKRTNQSDIDDLYVCDRCSLLFFGGTKKDDKNLDINDWIEFVNTDHPLFGSVGRIIERDKDFSFFRIELNIGELWVPYYWIKKRGDLNVKSK